MGISNLGRVTLRSFGVSWPDWGSWVCSGSVGRFWGWGKEIREVSVTEYGAHDKQLIVLS